MRQMMDNHRHALDRLVVHLDRPRTAVECYIPVFGREIGGSQYGFALVEAMAHCMHLVHTGRAERRISEDGAWRFVAA